MRNILFVAYDVVSRTTVRDERVPGGARRESVERYVEQRKVFEEFGKLILERTSGVHRRRSTPPEGMYPPTPQELRDREDRDWERRRAMIQSVIPISDFLVLPADSGIYDALVEVVEEVLRLGKPVLITRRENPPLHVASSDRFLGRDGVTYVMHGDLQDARALRDFRTNVLRFIQGVPLRMSKADRR